MTDGRFRNYLIDGSDTRFPAPGSDTRFRASGEDARYHPVLSLAPELFLDWRDEATLFQDAAGSVAATPGGDLVRLGLDKSNSLQRGPELWNPADVTASAIWTESGGVFSKPATGSGELGLTTLLARGWYLLEFTVSATAGVLYLWRVNAAGTGNEQAYSNLGTGTYQAIIQAGPAPNGQGQYIWFNGAGFTGTLTVESFRTLPGNHVAAPSDAVRPVYAADRTLTDDSSKSLIAPLTGTFSAYIAAGGALVADENVVMADDYDLLRNGMTGAVVVSGTLAAAQRQQLADHFGVAA